MEFGEVIATQGEGFRWLSVILKGAAMVKVGGNMVTTLGQGDEFGQWTMCGPLESSASVIVTDGTSEIGMITDEGLAECLTKAEESVVAANFALHMKRFGLARKIPIFAICDDTYIDAVANALTAVTVEKEQVIFEDGDLGDAMYIIEQGTVDIVSRRSMKTNATLEPGGIFGEVAVVKKSQRNSAAISGAQGCTLLKLDKKSYDAIAVRYSEYMEKIRSLVDERSKAHIESNLPLHLAVRSGKVENVEKILSIARNVSKAMENMDDGGWTSVHEAAHGNHLEVLKYLKSRGAVLESKNNEGSTPLHLAAANNSVECVEYLLQQKCDPESSNEDGSTPLHLASRVGNPESCEILIKNKANCNATDLIGNTPLHLACNCGNFETVKMLLKQGADWNARNEEGAQPVHMAALGGSGPCLKLILDAGAAANIDIGDKSGASPLQYSANARAAETCLMLLEHGANPNANDINGHIPLHHAAFMDAIDCIRIMLHYKGSKRAKGQDGLVPYMMARLAGNKEAEELLFFEDIPLLIATRERDFDKVNQLLEEGRSPNECFDDKWTPVHEASAKGFTEILEVLDKAGGDLNAQDEENETPLGVAAWNGNLDTVVYLLENGARPSITKKNNQGQRPVHLALRKGRWDIAKLLMEFGCDLDEKDIFGNSVRDMARMGGATDEILDDILSAHPDAMTIHKAARAKDMDALESVLSRPGFNGIDSLDNEGWTALRICAADGWNEGVARLLEAGADVEAKNHEGDTALHLSAGNGSPAVVKTLLQGGGDRNTMNESGKYPYDIAVQNKHEDAALLLIRDSLIPAAARGDVETVKRLLKAGKDPNQRGDFGTTASIEAAKGGHEAVLQALADYKADFNLKDDSETAALHFIATMGYSEAHGSMAKLLLAHGADVEIKDANKRTPLHRAAQEDHDYVIKVLLAHEANADASDVNGRRPLHLAAAAGSPGAVKTLSNIADCEAADKNGVIPFDAAVDNKKKECAVILANNEYLFLAASAGKSDRIRTVLDYGCKVNAADEIGSTALHKAARNGRADAVRTLIEREANVNAQDHIGVSSLHEAVKIGNLEIVEELLKNGANPNAVESAGETPLHWAARLGHDKIATALLQRGANANAQNQKGETALYIAAQSDKPKAVAAVLAERGDKKIAAHDGKIPFVIADTMGHAECAKLLADKGGLHAAAAAGDLDKIRQLLKYGDDVNEREETGATPLHYAIRAGQVEAGKLLLDSKADVNAQDNSKRTALHDAASKATGMDDEIALLVKRGANVNLIDSRKRTALHYVADQGRENLAKLLTGSDGAVQDEKGDTALMLAARKNAATVKEVLGYDSSDKVKQLKNAAGHTAYDNAVAANRGDCAALIGGIDALVRAAGAGRDKEVSLLLEGRVLDVDQAGSEGFNALYAAAAGGHDTTAGIILRFEADPNVAESKEGSTPLHAASANGHAGVVSTLLKSKGVHVDATDKARRTPLHRASRLKEGRVAGLLLGAKANKDAQDDKLWTPLFHAADADSPEAIKALLAQGADKRLKAASGKIPYDQAAEKGHKVCAALLADKYALHEACAQGDIQRVTELIALNADVNEADATSKAAPPLHYALRGGHSKVAALLLEKGANVDMIDNDGVVGLHIAAERADEASVAVLVAARANVNMKNLKKYTPLHCLAAGENGRGNKGAAVKAIVRALTSAKGCEVNPREGEHGQTPLHVAARVGSVDAVEALVGVTGVDRSIADKSGATAFQTALAAEQYPCAARLATVDDLIAAAGAGQIGLVTRLLDGGMDVRGRGTGGLSSLHAAARGGHTDVVKLLLERGADASAQDDNGRTPLHEGSLGGHDAVMQVLVDVKGVNVNAKDHKGHTPLHEASKAKKAVGRPAQLLMDHGADVNAECGSGFTPLWYAASGDSPAVIRTLLGGNANKALGKEKPYDVAVAKGHHQCAALLADRYALHKAAAAGDVPQLKRLLELGAEVEERDDEGWTPLHHAVLNGHVKAAGYLIEKKASVAATRPKDGFASLHLAAMKGDDAMASLLLSSGAEVDQRGTVKRETPLILAAAYSHPEVARTLLRSKANANAQDTAGDAPLHHSARAGSTKVVSVLLSGGSAPLASTAGKTSTASLVSSKGGAAGAGAAISGGADRDIVNALNESPFEVALSRKQYACAVLLADAGMLIRAAGVGNIELVTHLLDGGMDASVVHNETTALHAASAGGHEQVVDLLLRRGADPKAKDKHGALAIHCAASGGHEGCLRVLVNAGSPIDARDRQKHTPLHLVSLIPGAKSAAVFLLSKGAAKDAVDEQGETPLHAAASMNAVGPIEALLAAGANKELSSKEGKIPYEVAILRNHREAAVLLADQYALHRAAAEGDVTKIHALLDIGVPVNLTRDDGTTPLHAAAETGQTASIEALLRRGGDPGLASASGDTPLHTACFFGSVQAAAVLARDPGSKVNAQNQRGETPLHVSASHSGNCVDVLVSAGGNVEARDRHSRTPLHNAGVAGSNTAIRALLAAKASKQSTDAAEQTPYDLAVAEKHFESAVLLADGDALHNAASAGDAPLVTQLLKIGVSVNALNSAGDTALICAARAGHIGIVTQLLGQKADPNIPNETTLVTPLLAACEQGQDGVVKELLRAGARGGVQDAQGNTCLHLAAKRNFGEIMSVLLSSISSAEVPIDRSNAAQKTALYIAAEHGSIPAVRALLDAGANKSIGVSGGGGGGGGSGAGVSTPYDAAVRGNHIECAVLLGGNDPLIEACARGDVDTVKSMLNAGADPNAVGSTGDTPLAAAARGAHASVISALLMNGASIQPETLHHLLEGAALAGGGLVRGAGGSSSSTNLSAGSSANLSLNLSESRLRDVEASLKVLVDAGADVNRSTGKHLVTPLHLAARLSEQLVSLLCGSGARVNEKDADGRTPLHYAASSGRAATVQSLLGNAASKSLANKFNQLAYDEAVAGGHMECAKLLADPMALHAAASDGDVPKILALLSHGVAVDAVDPSGSTALHQASRRGHRAAVVALLDNGANVNAQDASHTTALAAAATAGHGAVVSALLGRSADPALADLDGKTALHHSAAQGHTPVTESLIHRGTQLLTQGDNKGNTPLHLAAANGRVGDVTALLKSRAKTDVKNAQGQIPYDCAVTNRHEECAALLGGADMLVRAAGEGDINAVRGLLQVGSIRVDARGGPLRETALHAAARGGHEAIVRMLLSAPHKADPRATDETESQTPLHAACEGGNAACVEMILGAAPDTLSAKDRSGASPLHIAALNNRSPAVLQLHSHEHGKLDLSARDNAGSTALHYAASKGADQAVQQLLSLGAAKNAKNTQDRLPYDVAVLNDFPKTAAMLALPEVLNRAAAAGDSERVARLLSDGISARGADAAGMTALHCAMQGGHEHVVSMLLEAGADPNAVENTHGYAPIHYGAMHGDQRAMRVLLEHKGTDGFARDRDGRTALHHASIANQPAVIQVLAEILPQQQKLANGTVGAGASANISSPGSTANLKSVRGNAGLTRTNAGAGGGGGGGAAVVGSANSDRGNWMHWVDSDGWSALHCAAKEGSVSAVRQLLKIPVTIEQKTASRDAETAYTIAVRHGKSEVAALLMGKYALHAAARAGDIDQIHALVAGGIDVNMRDDNGDTALHVAVRSNQIGAGLALLDHHCDAEATETKDGGLTALSLATKLGHVDAVRALVGYRDSRGGGKLNVDALDTSGRTALHHAVSGNMSEISVVLLSQGNADPNIYSSAGNAPIHIAASKGYVESIKALLADKRTDALAKEKHGTGPIPYEIATTRGHTEAAALLPHPFMLIWAAREGDSVKVSHLLARGENPSTVDDKGMTALHHAAARGHQHCCELLIEGSAPINARDNQGRSALHLAAKQGATELVGLLLSKGADPMVLDEKGRTALHYAAENNHSSVCKLLVGSGIPVENPDVEGATPGHLAAGAGARSALQYLRNHGAQWRTSDKHGKLMYDYAFESKQAEIVSLLSDVEVLKMLVSDRDSDRLMILLKNGADPNARDSAGRTALHHAMRLDHAAQVVDLTSMLGDLAIVDTKGNSPLHAAAETGANNAIVVALERGANRRVANRAKEIPYDVAKRLGFEESARLLAIPSELLMACEAGDVDWIKRVLEAKPKPNLDVRDQHGRTPLHIVMGLGNLKAAGLILAAGADFMPKDNDGKTPSEVAVDAGFQSKLEGLLHNRVAANDLRGVQHLVQLGANIEYRDKRDQITPLHRAARMGLDQMVNGLIHLQANPVVRDSEGRTPLHDASRSGSAACVTNLIQAAPEVVHIPDHAKRTPLHYAAAAAEYESAVALVTHGADKAARDASNQRPEHVTPNTSRGIRVRKYLALDNDTGAMASPRNPISLADKSGSPRAPSPTLLSYKLLKEQSPTKSAWGDDSGNYTSNGHGSHSTPQPPRISVLPPRAPHSDPVVRTISGRSGSTLNSRPSDQYLSSSGDGNSLRSGKGGGKSPRSEVDELLASDEPPDLDNYWEKVRSQRKPPAQDDLALNLPRSRTTVSILKSARDMTSSKSTAVLGGDIKSGNAAAPKWVPAGRLGKPLGSVVDLQSSKVSPGLYGGGPRANTH